MKKNFQKVVAAALAVMLCATAAPAAIPSVEAADEGLTAHYDMSHNENALTDISGKGNHAALVDTTDDAFTSYGGEDVLQFQKQQYANIPAGVVTGEDFTVEITLSTQTKTAHWAWCFGQGVGTWDADNVGNYYFINPSRSENNADGVILGGAKVGSVKSNEKRITSPSSYNAGYNTISLVNKDKTLYLYVNGSKVAEQAHGYSTKDVIKDGDVIGYIGKSLFAPDALLTANVADMKIWDKALTEDEITANLPSAEDKTKMVTADVLKTVLGENESAEAVTKDLAFPETIDGISITWKESSNPEVIDSKGTVNAATDKDTEVEIPFSFTLDGKKVNESITVKVLKVDADAALKEALNSVDIPNKDDVRGNITLPETAANKATVEWTTDNAKIVNVNEIPATVEGYDPTPAGTITRPDKDTTVKMTAKVTLAGKTATKDINIRVKAAPEKIKESDYTDYFFSYFAGEGSEDGEQIFFAASQDGLNWSDLNDNKPVLTSNLGDKGVRDPYIIRSPEGDKFYIIATDLRIANGNGWGAAQTAGSQAIMVWESTDLVNWSEQRMVTVSAAIDAGCTWAPEIAYDELTGEYVVFWASKVASDGHAKQRVYYAKTRDFYSFTDPEVFIDYDQSTIDSTILHENGTYYRYSKNEGGNTNQLGAITKSIFAEKSSTLLGSYTNIPSASLNKPNAYPGGNQWVEGPAIFKFNEDDNANAKYCLLVDYFGGIGYYPLVTNDLDSGEFTVPEFKMPSRARHGTPIRVTAEEYSRVMQQWGRQPVDKTKLQEAVDAEEDAALKADDYTEATWNAYDAALKAAKDVLENKDATAANVSAAIENLKEAKAALEPAVNVVDKFVDISADDWFVDYVQYVYTKGIMTGLDDTHFGSAQNLSRAQFATILHRMEGKPDAEGGKSFPDVKDGEFYAEAVAWASSDSVKVISGYADQTFGPSDNITREQMAVMMYRYAKYKGYDTSASKELNYPDAEDVSEFAEEAMKWAVGAGLISGNADGTLAPQGNTSRAVCSTIIQRFLEKVK